MAVIQDHVQPPGPVSRECSPEYLTMVDHHHHHRPATPDRTSRSSFSSIREDDSSLTQDFSRSKVSSYLRLEDAIAVDDRDHIDHAARSPSPPASQTRPNMIQTQFRAPATHPHSRLLGYWSPAETFQGWKQIQVKGKLASKSFGDLQVLNNVWMTPTKPKVAKRGANRPGEAPIERLPPEILTSIINLLAIDVPPNGITRRNVDLMSLLLTSRTLHVATLSTLYRNITIPHSKIFHKFLMHITEYPALGTIVRRMDFCHFNPSQLFSTAAERSKAKNLTSETLLRCLELMPDLQEFLAQEYIDDDIDAAVLRKLLFGLPNLQALDFCGCSSNKFKEAFSSLLALDWPEKLSITRLSLHKCMTMPTAIVEMILPRLPRVTHLDLAGTRVTDAALMSIPATARLTHLNLARCKNLSARGVIDFLSQHPAAQELVYLSLATDARTNQLLDVDDVTELLQILPRTLRSLSLKGSRMEPSHIDLLRPLTKHLEELAIGRSLRLQDVNRLFIPDDTDDIQMQVDWVPHTLKYIDLSDMWSSELDLVYLFGSECMILKRLSAPLEVVELAEDLFKRVSKSMPVLQRVGWRTSECGIRGWMVRQHIEGTPKDDGRRKWKMGAESWGMRKIPVAKADVGGMYGSFMFGRKL
ncbi:hypothetical protein QBC47DRAFT_20587 [Echria macrotheca]|uniref:F-box domain-containing protein n=1 Tax=Echria macrotheca TaxID=438768 RepID=A0AAJ0FF70_9PEZI|nr:hypothetical protein QBC47DRAFT_20587 [Echria macrotheca]